MFGGHCGRSRWGWGREMGDGDTEAAVGLGNDFGFSLNRLFSSLWRGGLPNLGRWALLWGQGSRCEALCYGGRAHLSSASGSQPDEVGSEIEMLSLWGFYNTERP